MAKSAPDFGFSTAMLPVSSTHACLLELYTEALQCSMELSA